MDLKDIFQELDGWVVKENELAFKSSHRLIKACEFKILGQTALLQSDLKIALQATADIDAYTNAEYSVIKKLDELLEPLGMKYDSLSSEIWMPEETEYEKIYSGKLVQVKYAYPEYLLIAKAKFAKEKNRVLLLDYLAADPSDLFFLLAKKYNINLDLNDE